MATSVPTMLRTIWWQNDDASISNRSRPSPSSVQPASVTRRTSDASRPSLCFGRRQNAEKSCSPSSASQPRDKREQVQRLLDVP